MKKILMSLLLSIAALLLPAGPVVDGNGNLQIGKLSAALDLLRPRLVRRGTGKRQLQSRSRFPAIQLR